MKAFLQRERFWLLGLTVVFGVSRFLFWRSGAHFEMGPLEEYWQYLDVELLAHDLASSLFYLHSQPPLFNLYLGLGLKLGPYHPILFATVHRLLGWVFCLAAYGLFRYFGIPRLLAAITASLLVLRASFVLQENLLFYDIPTTTFLVVAAVGLAASLREKPWGSTLFFGSLFLLCASRSLFHLAFFVLALVLWALATQTRHWRQAAPALIAFLLLVALYAKNSWLFGQFGASSWFGMNLARVVITGYSEEERQEKIARGELSQLLAIKPMVPLHHYPVGLWPDGPPASHPALVRPNKAGGAPNFNHYAFVQLGRSYQMAAWAALRAEPGPYLYTFWRNCRYMLRPTTDVHTLAPYRASLEPYVSWWEGPLAGRFTVQVGEHLGKKRYTHRYWVFWLWPLGLALGCAWLALSGRSGRWALRSDQRWTLAFLLASILWVAVVGNLFEVGENQRFRFYTDPFLVLLLVGIASRLLPSRDPRGAE